MSRSSLQDAARRNPQQMAKSITSTIETIIQHNTLKSVYTIFLSALNTMNELLLLSVDMYDSSDSGSTYTQEPIVTLIDVQLMLKLLEWIYANVIDLSSDTLEHTCGNDWNDCKSNDWSVMMRKLLHLLSHVYA